ncbi:hypothetical protein AVEN_29140-1 [Araneus ventricosus]|uniref:Uncharacterized protein n=1 Tax=Araneus ventricosus TaxID=182803 RepID=A0A4Y2ALQ4_ARAVE|nr:hypothetical protein AVEN_29140-1 [Araneus ventricosus]
MVNKAVKASLIKVDVYSHNALLKPKNLSQCPKAYYYNYGLIHHPWLNPDQRLKGNLHEQANADRNDRLDVSPNWRAGEKLVWLEG